VCKYLPIAALIDRVSAAMGRVAEYLVILACTISAANAFSRYAFSISSNAWLEIQWYSFGALVMLGAAETLKKNAHVRVDVFLSNMTTRQQIKVDIIGGLLFLLPATLILAYLSWPVFWNAWQLGEVSNNAGGLMRWPIKLCLPLGFLLLALQGISELIKRFAMLSGDLTADLHYERPLQ